MGSDGRYGPHSMRLYALRSFIIPFYLSDPHVSEVIVVGEYEDGPGYTYLNVPSKHYSSADALAQRQAGFEASTGDTIIFQHDDHILDPKWASNLDSRADVLIPQRWTRLRSSTPERLNNGEPECNPGVKEYISGHCAIYKRAVLEVCPWGKVPQIRTWDCQHTWQIRDAGFRVTRSDTLKVWDVEFGSSPWE
jgi:hypothetical protein